jgi:serine/threonine-protein kinase
VLRGLAYAHAQGVVHRDIKPENVFLCRHDDDPEFAKILDFGIAKLFGASAAEQSTVTQAGMTVGTPTYLSPEQAFGGTIGPASDVYSLSVVLYEMIAGRPPFEDEEPVKLLSAHATREVPHFAPELAIPPQVEELVRRGLAKTTDARFASADEYVTEIDRVRTELIPGFVRAATLAPFPALAIAEASGPYARAATPMPMPTASAIHALPKRKLSLGWIVAAILTVGVIAAIAAGGGGSSAPAAGTAPISGGVVPVPMPMPSVVPSPEDKELQLKAALHDLESGATCADRKQAVATLRDLGDARAIPALKKARYRGRGGVLGIGESNTNACLAADAKAAIVELGGK